MYFASATTDLATAIGALAALLAGVWAIVKLVLTQAAKDREADRTERKELVKALKNVASSNEKIAVEAALSRAVQEKGFQEAKERNGHLAELQLAGQTMVKEIGERNYQAITNIKEQHVVQQHIDRSVVKDETVKHEKVISKE